MRINSATKQYITKLISDKAAIAKKPLEEKLNALIEKHKAEKEEVGKKFNAEIAKAKEACLKAVNAALKKYGVVRECRWDGRLYEAEVCVSNADFVGIKTFKEKEEELEVKIRGIDGKVKDSTVEIIAKMTLGGDMNTLMQMIAELKF